METEAKQALVRLDVAAQPKDRMYDMSIRFTADITFTDPDAMQLIGGNPALRGALKLRVDQTVPFIPDRETLQKYAKILEETYEEPEHHIKAANVRFDGYNYIYAVGPDKTPGPQD